MKIRVLLVVVGALLMVFAVREVLVGGTVTAPVSSGKWLLASALGHDLLLAPVVAVAGWLLARVVPIGVRTVVAGGLVTMGAITLLAVPVLLGRGGGGNSTTTPLNYGRGWLICIGVVAAVTAATAGVRAARNRRSPHVHDSTTS